MTTRTRMLTSASLALLLVFCASGVAAQKPPAKAPAAAAPAAPLAYELRFDKPNTHLLDITIRATGLRGPAVEFALPAWAPGSYHINDYAKMVQGFSATDTSGRPLAWRKTDKQTWRIEIGAATAATVRYKLYGNTLADNWVQYNDQHAHIAGPAAWMYLVNGKQRPIQLTIEAPQGWRVATGMPRAGENTFTAADYDWFADAPLEISDFAEKTFTFAGATYHFVVHDAMGRKDFSRAAQDTQKLVETLVPMFAPAREAARLAPFDEYWFLMHVWPAGTAGLEHLNSTQINFSSDWDSARPAALLVPELERFGTDYNLKLFVIAHEFFHAWNVKRLRPKPLGPFDYSREVHTPSLWISEGLTSYYGELALVRAGLLKPEAYLESISKLITEVENHPARKERSIEDTSWDTWFGASPPGDANLQNTDFSYYDGGQIMGHLLDFTVRNATGNQKSLDDWMRLLYARYALPKPGFEPEDAVRAASEVAGRDLRDFFRRHITGKEPPPYETCFGYAGIRVEKETHASGPWLGMASVRSDAGWTVLTNVLPGGPAEQAGLDRGDFIVALDGRAIGFADFHRTLESKKPGDTLKLTVNRLGAQKEFVVTLGADPTVTYTLKRVENPTELQKKIYESWIAGH